MKNIFSIGPTVGRKIRAVRRRIYYPYSPASDKLKAIFIHVPKAAGTSVRTAIGEPPVGRRHLPWWVYKDADPRKFEFYFKFAFVRDPVDRALSGYLYLLNGGNKKDDFDISDKIKETDNFDEFVRSYLTDSYMLLHPILRPQSSFLCNWEGEPQVDFIGTFENINEDFKFIAQKVGIANFLPKENVTKIQTSRLNVSDETRVLLSKIYRSDYQLIHKITGCADYEIFGY